MAKSRIAVAFGRQLRAVRLARGLTQEVLATKVGLDRSYVGSVERGERNISLENIGRLASTLRVPPAELLSFPASEAR